MERLRPNSTLAVVVKDAPALFLHIHILLCHFYAFEIPLTVATADAMGWEERPYRISAPERLDLGASVSEFITPLTCAVTSGWIPALYVCEFHAVSPSMESELEHSLKIASNQLIHLLLPPAC